MQGFDIVTLRVFLATARLGSIGAAAKNEHIAASAVSRRIRDIEQELDTDLIIRTPAGTNLTSAGKAFSIHCEELLSKYADIRTDLKRFARGQAGDLRIAAIPRAIDGTLPFIVAQFKQETPDVHVTIQEIFSRQGVQVLREDLADLAIVYDSVDLKGLQSIPFKQDPLWIVGNKDHPLFLRYKDNESISYKDTLRYEHISYHDGGVLDDLIADARRKAGKKLKYSVKLSRVTSLFKCVEAGLGLGIIGERELQPYWQNKNLKYVPLADSWAVRKLVCVFPKGQSASPAVSRFLDYLSDKNM